LLTKTKLDHPVDAVGVGGWVLKGEARCQEGSFVHEQNQVLDRLVVLVHIHLLFESLDDGVVRVDLQVLLGCHVAHGAGVAQGLGFHDSLHVGGPTVLACHDTAWRVDQTIGHSHLHIDIHKFKKRLTRGNTKYENHNH